MNIRQRLENYKAGQRSSDRTVTVSKTVYQKAHNHTVWINPANSGRDQSYARVHSATSDKTYNVVLYVDDAKIFPTFPYVWSCDCRWGRERFEPCSHVIAVALERGQLYDDEYRSVDSSREEGAQVDLGISA